MESTGVQTAQEATVAEEVNQAVETTDTGAGAASGFISTEAAPAEVPKKLKHRGGITSIEAVTANSGSRAIQINVHSDSNGKDYKRVIWPPMAWVENVRITGAQLQALPAPEGLTAAGNPKQTPYQRFGRTISSTDGRAELQEALRAGEKAGRTLDANYTDFDSLCANLNAGLAGTPIVFITGADGEPSVEYGFRIVVKSILPHDVNFDKLKAEDAAG